MAKKCLKVVINIVIAVTMVFSFVLCGRSSNSFTEEEHLKRVSKLVENRYIKSELYTGYKIYPLYNETEELEFFLVDLEPQGFVYIKINEQSFIFSGLGMYTRSSHESSAWRRYKVEKGIQPIPTMIVDGHLMQYPDRKWEVDENGDYIDYTDSHFKVANIREEKRYLLSTYPEHYYIPAVKRGEKYLNLVSMEEIDYKIGMNSDNVAIGDIFL